MRRQRLGRGRAQSVEDRLETWPLIRPALVRPDAVLVRDRAVVVEPHQLDHFTDVLVGLDAARGRTLPIREDGVVDDAPLGVELGPHVPREGEVSRAIAVQMTDLAAADLERELAAAAGAGLDSRPGGDLVGDALARAAGG